MGRGASLSVHGALGDLDDEQHGVLVLVAEGSADDVHGVLVGDPPQGDPVHRHQLEPSLEGREGRGGRVGGERETGRERGFGTGLEQTGNKLISGAMHKAYFV